MQNAKKSSIIQIDPRLFDALQVVLQKHLPVIPPGIPLAKLTTVLDAGCGLHQWGKALFRVMIEQAGPDLVSDVLIEGVELRPDIAQTANAQIRTGRGQVFVSQGDVFHFPANRTERYDLVHARFLAPYISPHDWPALLAGLVHMCKSGGWVVWIEPAFPTKGERTPGWNNLLDSIERVVAQLGGSPQIVGSMETLFHQSGSWKVIKTSNVSIPFSTISSASGSLLIEQYRTLRSQFLALRPVMIAGGISTDTFEHIFQEVLNEFNTRTVASQWMWKAIYGQKQ
jgi:Methyltransferase domain